MWTLFLRTILALGVGALMAGGATSVEAKDRCALEDPTTPLASECEDLYVLKEMKLPKACETMPLGDDECGRWYDASSPLRMLVLRDMHFRFGKSELRESAHPLFRRYLQVMKENPRAKILIVGHADSIGDEDYNKTLSEQRAQAVKNLLVRRGIAAKRIEVEARGESAPIDSNETVAGRRENRRVEVKFKGGLTRAYSQNVKLISGK